MYYNDANIYEFDKYKKNTICIQKIKLFLLFKTKTFFAKTVKTLHNNVIFDVITSIQLLLQVLTIREVTISEQIVFLACYSIELKWETVFFLRFKVGCQKHSAQNRDERKRRNSMEKKIASVLLNKLDVNPFLLKLSAVSI